MFGYLRDHMCQKQQVSSLKLYSVIAWTAISVFSRSAYHSMADVCRRLLAFCVSIGTWSNYLAGIKKIWQWWPEQTHSCNYLLRFIISPPPSIVYSVIAWTAISVFSRSAYHSMADVCRRLLAFCVSIGTWSNYLAGIKKIWQWWPEQTHSCNYLLRFIISPPVKYCHHIYIDL